MDHDPQVIAALQELHELTQQNAPESAGAAWADFIETLLHISGFNTHSPSRLRVLYARTFSAQDMDPEEFGL